ncbi:signal peptidase II [Roseomonas frigidaquae]|uniref:Lipoprotein signal peptidase n=3 Tax=Acetobacterales TaxID=3120395 RepID=A0ABS6HEU8_9PROT|nr:signal peptidase II [Roseomonas oleicola]NKE45262.1 signal peptidase II [Falsiroseomonas frigidaquae]
MAALAAGAVDQATKAWALGALWPPYSEGITVLPVLNLRLGFNTGVTFGMFADSAAGAAWVLVLVTLAITGVLLRWLWRRTSRVEALALGLIIGGALGNAVDRLRIGAVVDFLDAHYAGWHWPTFNMADVAIVCGVALLILAGLRPASAENTTAFQNTGSKIQ